MEHGEGNPGGCDGKVILHKHCAHRVNVRQHLNDEEKMPNVCNVYHRIIECTGHRFHFHYESEWMNKLKKTIRLYNTWSSIRFGTFLPKLERFHPIVFHFRMCRTLASFGTLMKLETIS